MKVIPGLAIPEPQSKHDYAWWVFPYAGAIFGECSACGESHYSRPSFYCPNCGATMVNVYDARKYHDELCAAVDDSTKNAEGERND